MISKFLNFNVSEYHLVLRRAKKDFTEDFVFAREIETGDSILLNNSWVEVKGFKKVSAKGLYAPLTLSGTILINGVLTSNYAHLKDHNLIHKAFWPLRAVYNLFGSSFTNVYINGVNWYASFLMFISENLGENSLNYRYESK